MGQACPSSVERSVTARQRLRFQLSGQLPRSLLRFHHEAHEPTKTTKLLSFFLIAMAAFVIFVSFAPFVMKPCQRNPHLHSTTSPDLTRHTHGCTGPWSTPDNVAA